MIAFRRKIIFANGSLFLGALFFSFLARSFVGFGLLLFAFTLMNIAIVYFFTRPIQNILKVIRPYLEGKEEFPAQIILQNDEAGAFNTLGQVLNSLTDRIQNQSDRATRQREETEEILQALGEGIIATDLSAKITFINASSSRMLRISGDALGKSILEQGTSELIKRCHELILHALQTGESSMQKWSSLAPPLFGFDFHSFGSPKWRSTRTSR